MSHLSNSLQLREKEREPELYKEGEKEDIRTKPVGYTDIPLLLADIDGGTTKNSETPNSSPVARTKQRNRAVGDQTTNVAEVLIMIYFEKLYFKFISHIKVSELPEKISTNIGKRGAKTVQDIECKKRKIVENMDDETKSLVGDLLKFIANQINVGGEVNWKRVGAKDRFKRKNMGTLRKHFHAAASLKLEELMTIFHLSEEHAGRLKQRYE